ncbi:ATP-dependent metallopeptidase FtsH/Yme1/Tma family protein [Hathewaya limosa]|uniref:Cell division protease FtsH n=1 Tax=Hathewaya limosa TaxID=1536 RepID=A0ABU0JN19_HATLI|nr:FtsH/Yme1/Tma family ATP-dependent metallopeptidase [Hathewaya limosa]MDQ0478471.1 cell division protease FtsH [Hathewaya limosa]
MKKKNKFLLIPIAFCIISLISMITVNLTYNKNLHKNYSTFLQEISSKKVSEVYLDNSSILTVKLKNGQVYKTDNPRKESLKEDLLKNNILVHENSFKSIQELIPALVFFISICSILYIILKTSKVFSKSSFSQCSIQAEAIQNCSYNFNSIAGNEEAKESVKDIINFLRTPEKYASYGARMPKGIILYGEPGTGKTLLAKAIAGEAGVPFYAVSGSDFVQVYVGVGAARIRDLFKKAKKQGGKAVIFIDEIDAIGKKRDGSKSGGSSDEKDQTLNALLTEMSGFNEKEGIIVIAATNRLDVLDPALLRPGRFDRHIEVALPDLQARDKIIKLYLKNKPHKNINFYEWAKKTAYFSGAKLESFINEAAIIACNEDSEYIDDFILDRAYSISLAGHEKINRDFIKEQDKKITAIHESGHALLSHILLPQEKISKVTIIPSTKGAGGYTLSIPEDSLFRDKSYLQNKIMVLLGGRAAEELYLGEENITTGASNDIEKCTNLIVRMISIYGMGQSIGLLNMNELSKLGINNSTLILDECTKTIEILYDETKKLIKKNKNLIDTMVNSLLDKETLYDSDLDIIFNNITFS